MKIKDIFSPFFFVVLGIAFLGVSAWVFLSNNKSAKAIRYKYRLGGMILSLSFFTTSCIPLTTCYDPAPIDNTIYLSHYGENSFAIGDTLFFSIESPTYPYYSYLISDSTSTKNLQEGMLSSSEDHWRYHVPLTENPEYTGKINIKIFGEETNEIKHSKLLFTGISNIHAEEN
ncbi:hypothetical protein D0T49_11665 [Paludibacter sp. 221]|uniref:hypothetical protein n=1 Tax=Paludibacter sp. 221 TaxID=2302939 RepID=UPI0013D48CB6|nr:hypothetical protein [Paludibacter sp. 221]NDV47704.1 hypothetical protein [Paludibacter sp. 221]